MNIQAVSNHEGRLLYVDCSWPGSVRDAKIFNNSSINKIFQNENLPNVKRKLNEGDEFLVGPVLIGDPTDPLLPGILKEFSTCTSNGEVIFIVKSRSVRNQIEYAFGRLKARWRILN